MALKRKITKAEFAALAPLLQAEYRAEGEDYLLNAEGFDDPAELKRAKDRETQAAKDARERAEKAENELRTLKEGNARAAGDVTALEKSYKEKEALKEQEHKAEIAKRDKHLQATLVDSVASQLAAEIAGDNAAILLPHIKSRLTADLTGDVPLTRVLDKDGKPSAFGIEDLKKEFVSDNRFKAVVIASKANGGAGGNGKPSSGSGAPVTKKFGELNDSERVQLYKDDPAKFNELSAAHQASVRDAASQPRRHF